MGRGRVVYFPWDIDRTFWEVLSVDHFKLLRNAVQWTSGGEQPVEVIGQGVLDIAVWEQKDSMTVHLVNLTNPMMMKGPLREVIPAPPQKVRIRAPKGRQVTGVQLLVAGRKVAHRLSSGWIDVDVPSMGLHEVVALDLRNS